MVRQIPVERRTISVNPRVQETGGDFSGAKTTRDLANTLLNERDNYQQQAVQNAYLRGQVNLNDEMHRLEQQYSDNPDAMAVALKEHNTSFLGGITDPEMKGRFELQLNKAGQSILARSTQKRKRLINEQSKFDNLQALDAIKNQLPGISGGLLSSDDAVAMAAAEELQEVMLRGQGVLGTTDAEGLPLFGASFRVGQLGDLKDNVLQGAVSSWFEEQPDKVKALNIFESGELKLNLPDGEGGFDEVNVRDSVSPQAARFIQASANKQIAEAEAAAKQQRALTYSNMDLAITTAEADPETGMTKNQKLNNMLQQIDNNPMFSNTAEGIIKGNNLRKKVFQGLEDEKKEFEDVAVGSAFASGDAYFNRQDKDHKKAYESYYKSIEPQLATMDPMQRNITITNMIDNAKAVPKKLTGDIQRMARSRDVDQITMAADLLDRVATQNPHLIGDIAPQKDLARIQMVNSRIDQGYAPEAALEATDELLDPRNEITLQAASAELRDKKIDYREKSADLFDASGIAEFFTLGIAGLDEPETKEQMRVRDDLTAAYQVAFEDHYRITRDEKLSAERADAFVKGRFSTTKINGTTQIMPFSPEKYYSIPNEDNDWMRKQMVDVAHKALPDIPREELEENVMLIPDPSVTRRTATQGSPAYKLMIKA